MSSLYKMSGSYRVHLTASHWGEAYDELKHRTDRTENRSAPQRGPGATIHRREGHAFKSKASTRH